MTYLKYVWNIRFSENVQGTDEKFLIKPETLDFVKDMIASSDGDGFKAFFQSISSLVLYNDDLTLSVRSEYSDMIVEELKKLNVEDDKTEEVELYKKYFAKEFNYCESQGLPLKVYLSDLYWGIGTAEKLYNKNYERAFCSFLYSGVSGERTAWYEQLMSIYGEIDQDANLGEFFSDFGERVKEYRLATLDKAGHKSYEEDGYTYIKDNGQFTRYIRGINNDIRSYKNNLILKDILKDEEK